MKILKKFPTLCDFCTITKPTLVYDVPPGLPLWLDTTTGMLTCSSGWIGACEECRKVVDLGGENVAHRLAERFLECPALREALAKGPNRGNLAGVLEWRARLNRLLLKKITNLKAPRPYVPFEDPLEGKFVEVTA